MAPIEALRQCQSTFLEQLSHQLIKLDKFTYTPADVRQALDNMGMAEIAQEACLRQGQNPQSTTTDRTHAQDPTSHMRHSDATTTTTTFTTSTTATATTAATTKKRGRKKKVVPKWSQELEDEQERLLAQTKRDMDEKHGDADGMDRA